MNVGNFGTYSGLILNMCLVKLVLSCAFARLEVSLHFNVCGIR